jgi:hypothetical protein
LFGETPTAKVARAGLLITVHAICFALIPFVWSALGLPRWAGAGVGLAAAAIPVHRTAEIFRAWDEPYAAAGLMLAVGWLNASAGLGSDRVRSWLAYGAWWGLLLHMLFPVYATLAVIDIVTHRTARRAARWALAVAVSALTLLPWMIRNRIELGAWIFVRSNSGIELTMAFGDGVGVSTEDNLRLGRYRTVHPSQSVTAATELRDEGEVAYNRRLTREAVEWVRTHPSQAATMVANLNRMFWFGNWETPETAWSFALSSGLALVGTAWL